MKRLKVEAIATVNDELENVTDVLTEISEKFRASLPDDMKIAMAAGVKIKIDAKETPTGILVTARTVQPISILKMPDGTPISVIVGKKDDPQKSF